VTPGPVGAAAPRRHYGWTAIVPSVFVILLVTNGLTLGGMAAFDPTLIAQLGVSRAEVKFGDFIQLGITALVTIGSGWLSDRYGVRPVMALGIAALAVGFFALGRVDSLADLYWARFMMGVGLAGAGLAICVVAVSRWFILRRGLALGVVLAGTSLGNGFFPRIFTTLIADEGLRAAADIAAVAILLLSFLVWWPLREWPASVGAEPYGRSRLAAAGVATEGDAQGAVGPVLSYREILARREFWLIGVAAFATFFAILGVNNNMILHMQALGLPPATGSLIAIPLFLAGLIGKLASGWLTDLLGRKPVWVASLCLMLGATLLLLTMQAGWVPIAAVILGLGWGANYTLLQAVVSDVFGTRSLGRVMGAITVLDAGGGALGPWVTAAIADGSGSYQAGFAAIALLLVAGLACASRLGISTPDRAVRGVG
jgi:MFS family permease